MRKILYFILIFILTACSSDNIFCTSDEATDHVELNFRVQIPDAPSASSRSMTDESFTHLYLLVFDENGFFNYQTEARLSGGSGSTREYSVDLRSSQDKKIIHFIATNKEIDYDIPGPESLLKSLTTSNNEDAYWQRIEINSLGKGTKLPDVFLVRNFLKINITNKATNFEPVGYSVVNIPSSGTMVPEIIYNGVSFPEFYDKSRNNEPFLYSELLEKNYTGFGDGKASILNSDSTNLDFKSFGTPTYMYERPYHDNKNHTYIIIKGHYENSKQLTYYKVDILYDDFYNGAVNYNLLRNFQYNVIINSVLKNGYSSSEVACNNVPDNNLSCSVETKSLLNVSDGYSQLTVSCIDTTIVTDDDIYYKFRYKPDVSVHVYQNDFVKIVTPKNGSVIDTMYVLPGVDSDGFSTLKVTPLPFSGETKHQIIRFYVPNSGLKSQLSRYCQITMRSRPDMQLSVTNPVPQVLNSKVDLKISLENGLGESLFPMSFEIESRKNSIYAKTSNNNYLPISFGGSIIPDNSNNTFRFVKTITYDEYHNNTNNVSLDDNKKVITCNFLTNTLASATDIYVYNKFCNISSTSFQNSGAPIINNKKIYLPAKSLRFDSSYWGYTIYIYSDAALNNLLSSFKVSRYGNRNNRKYYNGSDVNITFPENISTLYFVCYRWGTHKSTVSVTNLENASIANPLYISMP